MNSVTLYGNLGADPELKQLESGSLLKMRIATTERRKGKDDKWIDHTEWHQVTVWGKRAEGLAEILNKGDRVLVVGKLRTRSYESNGEKRYSTEIHADEIELAGKRNDASRDDARRPARNERPARRGRDEEPASDPFAGYK
jgi:single-strand DNA-binding protein